MKFATCYCPIVVAIFASIVLPMTVVVSGETTTDTESQPHAVDTNDSCTEWAEMGECDKNPAYMIVNCATSCGKITDARAAEQTQLAAISSLADIAVNDIDGNPISLEQYYRDNNGVLIIVNVASYCGYTESHYNGLIKLYDTIQNDETKPNITILAFPCNQFGQQEPGSAQEIKQFVQEKGVQFTMMEKINVNGNDAHVLYKYLKYKTGLDAIAWNFATYFMVVPGPNGTTIITAHSNVEPMELHPIAMSVLSSSSSKNQEEL